MATLTALWSLKLGSRQVPIFAVAVYRDISWVDAIAVSYTHLTLPTIYSV